MDVVVYESSDTTLLSIIEQALRDNGIPCMVIGGADTGLASAHLVRVSVPQESVKEAREIVKQIVDN